MRNRARPARGGGKWLALAAGALRAARAAHPCRRGARLASRWLPGEEASRRE